MTVNQHAQYRLQYKREFFSLVILVLYVPLDNSALTLFFVFFLIHNFPYGSCESILAIFTPALLFDA